MKPKQHLRVLFFQTVIYDLFNDVVLFKQHAKVKLVLPFQQEKISLSCKMVLNDSLLYSPTKLGCVFDYNTLGKEPD